MSDIQKMRETWKQAAGLAGPVGKVLDKYWNGIHDFVYDLNQVAHVYDRAASYAGTPGAKEAKAIVKQIRDAQKSLEQIVKGNGVIDKLLKAEWKFDQKHGDAEAYSNAQSAEMFPR